MQTWRNGGWLQESWANRSNRRLAQGADPRAELRKCLVLSHVPAEVEAALRSLQAFPPARNKPEVRWAGAAAPLNPNPFVARPAGPAPARPYNSPNNDAPNAPPKAAGSSVPASSSHRAAAPAAPVPAAFDQNTLKVAALLLVAPPAGVFLMWSLPSYPREGKVAASVAGLVWMMLLGVAFAAWLA